MMWGYGWPMMWGWGILMWLVPLGLVALLLGAIGRPGHRQGGMDANGHHAAATTDTALEILRQRLAKGEITDEEYDKLREKLLK